MKLIRELHEQGNTIILITHDTQIAANAPRQVQLLDGKIVRDTGEAGEISEMQRRRERK